MEEELSTSLDIRTVAGEEVNRTTVSYTTTDATRHDEPHYFPAVPEPLDEVPEK